ncbi:type 2C protein phosphatase PTC5 [Sugiyamaella lignohabitans]|uniref:Type 2C protein phosphatase PTC5 n=1 Tax=Sugiyamaella lignohabitans TaxID=796027 RepID=A0A167ED17_9ASCO|nr:type 2C protein phosphatase PTC5 [Sugiyamaella lignohabitans]ANB13921.1 type 2C protein phosphatase PTC5 [Sugiyamaella lignohabitans]
MSNPRVANDSPGPGGPGITGPSQAAGPVRLASNSAKQSISMLTPAQVSSRLRENEESYLVDRGKGVLRYDVAQLPSNNPIEDDRSERVVQVPLIVEPSGSTSSGSNSNSGSGNGVSEKSEVASGGETGENGETMVSSDWMFWGVYDGHSGWTTSAFLRDHLVAYVLNELDKVYEKSSPNSMYRLVPSPEVIDEAIQQGFLALDDEIVNKRVARLLESSGSSKASATELIAPALSGSCGLLAFYDTFSKNLRVAVTGDSRAVLGSRDSYGNWTATALSTDQTGSNIDEANRVRSEHPGEENTAIRNGRVLGSLEPTRAFGDARYKWARDIQHKIAQRFFGRRIPSELKTPPYVTAKPVVTTTKVNPENGDFLVMGSDGVFEMLSNEEVVSLVVQWLKAKRPEYLETTLKSSQSDGSGLFSKLFGSGKRSDRDDGALVEDISSNKEAQKQPIRRRNGVPVRFTVQDDNAATHIIRNALGGADQDQVSMLVSIPSPLARNYRDDLTVTVVFFGHDSTPSNDAGSIKVNQAGTRNGIRARSRL